MMEVTTVWKANHQFTSTNRNTNIEIDAKEGFGPKALLLAGVAGCSGVDVVDILEKMRVSFTALEINAAATQTEEHPRVFNSVQLVYRVQANEADREKIIKAIELSLEKYCGVAAMLRKNSPVEYRLELLPVA